MLANHSDMLRQYGSDYRLYEALNRGEVLKIARDVYSTEVFPDPEEVVCFAYPAAVLTMDSAFYLNGLTDVDPDAVHVATPRNTTRIGDQRFCGIPVRQYFMEPRLVGADSNGGTGTRGNTGAGTDVGIIEQDGLRVFSRERMLVELLRNPAAVEPDRYLELVEAYRGIVDQLDMGKVEACIGLFGYADSLRKKLQREVLRDGALRDGGKDC